jgi:hypothetical protein
MNEAFHKLRSRVHAITVECTRATAECAKGVAVSVMDIEGNLLQMHFIPVAEGACWNEAIADCCTEILGRLPRPGVHNDMGFGQ